MGLDGLMINPLDLGYGAFAFYYGLENIGFVQVYEANDFKLSLFEISVRKLAESAWVDDMLLFLTILFYCV